MNLFHHEEPQNAAKRCRFLKDVIASCHTFCRNISSENLEDEDDDVSDYDDEQEVYVSAVISQYMESKSKRKMGLAIDSFIWGFSPPESPPKEIQIQHAYVKEKDEFYSPCSRLSRCSSATTVEAFMSAKTNLSRCSSSFEFPSFKRRRSIIRKLCHYEGWPFGLCRKALLVPPLPKSPSESWLWCKSNRLVKIP